MDPLLSNDEKSKAEVRNGSSALYPDLHSQRVGLEKKASFQFEEDDNSTSNFFNSRYVTLK